MKVRSVTYRFAMLFILLATAEISSAGEISVTQENPAGGNIAIEQLSLLSSQQPSFSQQITTTPSPSASMSSGNRAVILQAGNDNNVQAIQDGNDNSINLVQKGRDNSADLAQHGRNNTIDLQQQGNGNSGTIHEQGNGHSVIVRQTGNGLDYSVTVSGPSQNVRVTQKK